jgi:PIN domain nuclease of toxin-antitoxin system
VILLDTCAAIWASISHPTLRRPARTAILEAVARRELFLSSVTAWEIATLARRGRLTLAISATAFVNQLYLHNGAVEISVDREIAFAAGSLSGELHGDPVDRLIVATAIVNGLRVMTRDRNILSYAKRTGAVPVIAC